MKIAAFCGIDGSGKTTQIQRIQNQLERKGKKVYVSKVILPVSQLRTVGSISLSEIEIGLCSIFLNHYLELLPVLQENSYDYVLCDRHSICLLAFAQSLGIEQLYLKKMRDILSLCPRPDTLLYFRLSPQTSFKRIAHRTAEDIDKYETEEFLTRKAQNYEELLRWPDFSYASVIDAAQPCERITDQILKLIE